MPLVFAVPAAIVALLTLTASLSAVFRVGRLKSLQEVEDTSARGAAAWQEERNAAIAKAERLADDILRLEARVKELETVNHRLQEQRDLTRYFDQQDANHREVVEELHAVAASNQSLATAIEVLAAMLRPLTAAQ